MTAPTITPYASEKVQEKAARLLASGSVTVVEATACEFTATVVGDTGRYEVVRRRGGWSCDCQCYRRCSHLTAVLRIAGAR